MNKSPLVVCAVALLLATGCSKKVPECNAITGVVNPTVDTMKKHGSKKSEKPAEIEADLRAMAAAATDASSKLEKLEITTEELKKHRTDLKEVYGTFGKAMSATADSLAAAGKAEAAADKAMKDINAASEKWADFCKAHPAEEAACKAMADAMHKLPNDPQKKAEADKAIAEMAKVDAKDEAGKAAGKALVAAFQASQRSLAEAKAAEDKAKKAQAEMDPLEKKEGATIDALNKFCAN